MDSALTAPTCVYRAQRPNFNEILQALTCLYPQCNLHIVIPSLRSRQSIQNRVYFDRRSTVYEDQERGVIGLAIEGEERIDRR